MGGSPVSPGIAGNAPVVITIDAGTDASTGAGWAVREQILYRYITGAVGQLVRCQGPQAVRSVVASAATGAGASFLMGISHGVQDCYSGFQLVDLYRVGAYNPAEVSGRVVHWTACETAAALGPDMIRQGAAAFIGYADDIVFPPELAQALFDCDAEVDRALLNGATAGEAFQRCIERYNAYIDECQKQGRGYLAQYLALNRDSLRVLGDLDARIR